MSMTTNKQTLDAQTRAELRKRYTPPEIPKCSVCGGELSIQRCGGGEPTVYACDGYEADHENPGMVRRAAGRDIADKHYEESRYIDWIKGGDSDVLALLDELEAAELRNAELNNFQQSRQRALTLLNDASTENLWETIGRLKTVISGDCRSDAEIHAATDKGE